MKLKLLLVLLLFAGTAFADTSISRTRFEVTVEAETDWTPGEDFNLFLQGGSHSVDLTWTASPDGGAPNIYRAPAACSTNPTFAKIASVAVGVNAFTDTPIAVGTYCYNVTTVVSGLESGPSNNAPAVVLPSSPSNAAAKQGS